MRISDWSSDVCSSDLPRIVVSAGDEEYSSSQRADWLLFITELNNRFVQFPPPPSLVVRLSVTRPGVVGTGSVLQRLRISCDSLLEIWLLMARTRLPMSSVG